MIGKYLLILNTITRLEGRDGAVQRRFEYMRFQTYEAAIAVANWIGVGTRIIGIMDPEHDAPDFREDDIGKQFWPNLPDDRRY